MEGLVPYVEKITQFPIIAIVLGSVAVFLARYTEVIFSGILGFLVGIYIVLPKIASYFPELEKWLSDPTTGKVIVVVFGVISGAIVYALFKFLAFVAGFLVSSALVYYAISIVRQTFDMDSIVSKIYSNPDLIYIGIAAGIGVWMGIVTQKREREIFTALSILAGSVLLSVSILYLVLRYLVAVEDPTGFITSEIGFYVSLGLFVVITVLGFRINFRGKTGEQPQS